MGANEPEWLTCNEVAAIFRVDTATAARWGAIWEKGEKDNKVRVHRTPGGRLRFNHDDIRALQSGR